MSDIVLGNAPRDSRIATLRAWLRQMRAALAVPSPLAGYLPDRYLRDIDLRRSEIQQAVDRDSTRLGLLDLGWQQPRRRQDF